jgi:hypothetical protein
MHKKLYISGKITGDDNYVQKFKQAEDVLLNGGYFPVNPVAHVPPKYASWDTAMRLVLKTMLDCDGVALLPDWKESKGAKIEARLASDLRMPVKPVEEWLEEVSE